MALDHFGSFTTYVFNYSQYIITYNGENYERYTTTEPIMNKYITIFYRFKY